MPIRGKCVSEQEGGGERKREAGGGVTAASRHLLHSSERARPQPREHPVQAPLACCPPRPPQPPALPCPRAARRRRLRCAPATRARKGRRRRRRGEGGARGAGHINIHGAGRGCARGAGPGVGAGRWPMAASCASGCFMASASQDDLLDQGAAFRSGRASAGGREGVVWQRLPVQRIRPEALVCSRRVILCQSMRQVGR